MAICEVGNGSAVTVDTPNGEMTIWPDGNTEKSPFQRAAERAGLLRASHPTCLKEEIEAKGFETIEDPCDLCMRTIAAHFTK